MNLQTGRICCLILILLASLETKAQVALEENNIEQYAALQLGYDSIGGNIKAQIKKQALIAALQGGIYREQRRIRKWKGAYQDYLSNERNVGKALAAGKNLYIQALRILDNLLLLKKAIQNNPQGIAANFPMNDLYLEVTAEFLSTFKILKTTISKGGKEYKLNGTERIQLMWTLSDKLTRLNDKVQTLAECINYYTLANVWNKAVAGKVGWTNGQIAERQRKEWIKRQKDNMKLYRR